ncbi:L,D-transpeptidase family protein [Amphritea sp. HPY]|uniref:L,D-transpeptidase family protein n=1 Tax=Amphritea sp. HPY TaxID=3421652 RepID=UPI003D7C70A5
MYVCLRCISGAFAFLLACLEASLAFAGVYVLPQGDGLVGAVSYIRTEYSDTLPDIARLYDIGYDEITRANPKVDIWLPGKGTRVVIPQLFVLPATPKRGLTLNLAERRIYYFPRSEDSDTKWVMTFPVGIGREGWQTPIGPARVVDKTAQPAWTPPQSIRDESLQQGIILPDHVPPGPDNPLGEYAIRLSLPGYLLHGTNKPYGIGMRVSHGCIRLYPEDIEVLFNYVALNTPVWIVDQSDKIGWRGDFLYLESHPVAYGRSRYHELELIAEIERVVGEEPVELDWSLVEQVHRRADGVPTLVGRRLLPFRK